MQPNLLLIPRNIHNEKIIAYSVAMLTEFNSAIIFHFYVYIIVVSIYSVKVRLSMIKIGFLAAHPSLV